MNVKTVNSPLTDTLFFSWLCCKPIPNRWLCTFH